MTYFISDLHFGHRNILRFDCRPFSTIEEHDEYIINQWNETVGADDDVWILGDVSWYSALKTVNILKRLNGIKHLCIGNHDHKLIKSADVQQQFVEIVDYKEISFGDGTGVVLCHYPIPCYNKHFYNWYHLYGHVHATFEWTINNFYSKLLTVPAVSSKTRKAQTECVTPSRVKEVHKLLRTAFKQAVIWEMIGKNPCDNAILPACKQSKREIWDVPTLQKAMEVCDDDVLRLAIHMSFAASLRMGEMLGLTLDCIDVSDKAIEENRAYIYIEKELQRVRRGALEALSEKDVIYKFPACIRSTHTVLVLKTPKTETSVRKVFLPKTVAYMVQERIKEIEEWKELFGDEFTDYNLLFCNTLGRPIEGSVIERAMAKLIRENDLPEVVFHSLRHTSITAKLKYNGGDIKSVQGDSGHARAEMVTDVYSHILDENRQANATRLDTMFYGNEPVESKKEDDPMTQITKLLSNPATAELLKQLAKTIA